MRTMMLVLVVLAVSCGTPERMSPEAGDKEAPEQTDDTSSATRSDEVCLPKDVFVDLVTDDPALACESKVVIVEVPEVVEVPTPAECPNVTVTCEPEIIEVPEVVEVPAECPEQPICAPEAVETRPPTFSMFDSPLDVDPSTRPSDQFRFLDVRLLGGDRNATVKALTFYVARYGVSEGYDYGNWDTVAACEVFDCSSFRIYWVHDGGFELVSDDLDASGTIATKLSTPAEWSHELPANAEDYLSVYARVHGDAPSGRYHITFNTYSVEQDGVPVTIAGLPAHGPEFTIGTETLEACESEATEEPTCSVGAATLSDSCIREVTARQHQAYYEQRIGCTHEGPYAGYCGRSSIFSIEYFGNCAPRLVESFALRLWKYEGSDAIEVDVRDVFHGDAMASLDLGLVGDAYRSAALIVEPDEDAVGSGESFTVSHIEGFPIPASGTASMDVSVQRRYDAEPGRYQFMLEQLTTTALDGTAPHVFEVFWGGQFVIVGPPEAESCRVEETILPSGPNNLVFTTPAFSEQLFSFELLGTCEEDLLLDTVTVQLVRQEGNGFVAASICETFACDCEREDCGGGPFGIMDANTGYWLGMDDVGLTLDGSQWFGTPFDRTTYPAPRTRLRIPATGSLKFALAGAPLASAIPGTYRFIIAGAKAMSTDFERYHQYNPTLGPAITIGE